MGPAPSTSTWLPRRLRRSRSTRACVARRAVPGARSRRRGARRSRRTSRRSSRCGARRAGRPALRVLRGASEMQHARGGGDGEVASPGSVRSRAEGGEGDGRARQRAVAERRGVRPRLAIVEVGKHSDGGPGCFRQGAVGGGGIVGPGRPHGDALATGRAREQANVVAGAAQQQRGPLDRSGAAGEEDGPPASGGRHGSFTAPPPHTAAQWTAKLGGGQGDAAAGGR